MKITKLRIYGFGKFIDQTILIDEKLQIIVGPNESGKTTIARFIHDLLFGFPTRKSALNRYVPKESSRYGGELYFSNSENNYLLIRTSGKRGGDFSLKNLTTAEELDVDDFQRLIDPINETIFYQVFDLSDDKLNQAFQMSQSELANRIRVIGAVGSGDWAELIGEYDEEAARLYKVRGRKQPIVVKLHELNQFEDQIAHKKRDFTAYQNLLLKKRNLNSENQQNQQQIDKLTQELEKFRNLASSWPAYERLHQISKKIASQNLRERIDEDAWQKFGVMKGQISQLESTTHQLYQKQKELNEKHPQSELMVIQQQNKVIWNQLVSQLPEMTQITSEISDLKKNAQSLQEEQSSFERDVKTAIPFDEATNEEVVELLNQQEQLVKNRPVEKSRLRQSEKKQTNTIFYLLGILVTAGSLILFHGGFKFVGTVVGILLLVAGYLSTQKSNLQLSKSPDDLIQVQNRLTKIAEEFQLSDFPQSQWFIVQSKLESLMENQRKLDNLSQKIKSNESLLDNYANSWKQLLPTHEENKAAVGNLFELKQLLDNLQQESQSMMDENNRTQLLAQQKSDTNEQIVIVQSKMQKFLEEHHRATASQFEADYQKQEVVAKDQATQSILKSELSDSVIEKLEQYTDLAAITDNISQIKGNMSQLAETNQTIIQQLADVNSQINIMMGDTKLEELLQKQASLQSEINELVFSWLTAVLSSKLITLVLDLAVSDRQPEILKLTNNYFKILTENRYNEVKFIDDQLTLIRKDSRSFNIIELSKGTAQQLYLAISFAFAVVISKQANLPLLIDDAFVNFDDVRKDTAIQLLNKLSQNIQVIYFTTNFSFSSELISNQIMTLKRQ